MGKEFMELANNQAKKAYDNNEVPVGAIIVCQGVVIAQGCNDKETNNKITGHAELNALHIASQIKDTWKLNDCELYVTVEPCLMCYAAIVQSRITKVYIGSIQDLNKKTSYKSKLKQSELTIDETLLNDESSKLMSDFFKKKIRGNND